MVQCLAETTGEAPAVRKHGLLPLFVVDDDDDLTLSLSWCYKFELLNSCAICYFCFCCCFSFSHWLYLAVTGSSYCAIC